MAASEGKGSIAASPAAFPIYSAIGGILLYLFLAHFAKVDQPNNLPGAYSALSTMFGTIGGFLITAAVFVAGSSGSAMTKMRAAAKENGKAYDIVTAMGLAIVLCVIAAAGLAVCIAFSNGWGATMAAVILSSMPIPSVAFAIGLSVSGFRQP
ncbi:hypothetical protein WKY82_10315 [Gordonia malaquae]|uniref:hypothetical protein n=1 Tax=Gordonia malaquae TaxID=410332 RepID=UPI0030C79010